MKKVLHYVSVMDRAGQETFIMNIYRHIDKNIVQFGFLCSNSKAGDYDNEILSLGGKIYHVELNNTSGRIRHIKNYIILKKQFQKYTSEYDVIHIHNYHAFDMFLSAKAALKAGFKKIIVHAHNSSADSHLQLHRICRPMLTRMPIVKLACSQDAGKWMYSSRDYSVIRNGIDISRFTFNRDIREQYRKQLNLKDKFVIGHIGRFDRQKNHQLIIEAFSLFLQLRNNAKLVLVGTGSLVTEIKRMVHQLNLDNDVIFLGVRSDVAELYQAFDMFFFPSLFEGLGIVAIEAQASDLTCLISDGLPKDVDITNKVIRCCLNATISEWCSKMDDCYKNNLELPRKNTRDLIKRAGFDATESAKMLQRIYLK